MRAPLVVFLVPALLLAGCGQTADNPEAYASPAAPTPALQSTAGASAAPTTTSEEVPFHSELAWTKVVNGGDPGPCQGLHGSAPDGMVYLMRNTSEGLAVTTHLGAGNYEIHTCVYGRVVDGRRTPAGWLADMHWTAANGDVLQATSEFLYWTGQPGRSVAVDRVTFQDGGTGRFAFAEGSGMGYVNAPEGTAVFDGTLRFGKKQK